LRLCFKKWFVHPFYTQKPQLQTEKNYGILKMPVNTEEGKFDNYTIPPLPGLG
jgi:hypothetical protein